MFQLLQRWVGSPWPTTHGLSVSFRTPAPTGECAHLCPTFLPVLEPSFSTLGVNISTPTSLVITCHTSSFNLFVLVFSLKEKQLWMLLKPLRAFSSSPLPCHNLPLSLSLPVSFHCQHSRTIELKKKKNLLSLPGLPAEYNGLGLFLWFENYSNRVSSFLENALHERVFPRNGANAGSFLNFSAPWPTCCGPTSLQGQSGSRNSPASTWRQTLSCLSKWKERRSEYSSKPFPRNPKILACKHIKYVCFYCK